MSAANFQLKGPGIDVDYRADGDELTVRGFGPRMSEAGDTFTGPAIARTATDVGELVEVTLLRIDRGGNSYTLALLLPDVALPPGDEPHEVTGTAVITHDISGRFAEPRGVLQDYDVRPLSGSMWN